jgi:hypothetical protein
MINSLFRCFIILILALFTGAAGAAPQKPAVNSTTDGIAVRGYDVVAYQDGQVVEGDARYERVWNGARWRFSSAANRDRFAAAPEKFAPQFGGYCAYAVSRGYTADIDPKAFKIVDGALYLNYSLGVQRSWERDVQGNIVKGRQNWPAVLNK